MKGARGILTRRSVVPRLPDHRSHVLEDPVPKRMRNTHQKFVVPLRSMWVWGTPGWVPMENHGEVPGFVPGRELNESRDKNTTFYPFSNYAFLHKDILRTKKRYFVLFIAIRSGSRVDSTEDKDPGTAETASPAR